MTATAQIQRTADRRRVHVANLATSLSVPADVTILQAALSAGLAYPHGCQIGRCGACKSRLLSGEVEQLAHTPFALTAADRERGFVLACRAQPRSDCTISWLGSDATEHPLRKASGRVASLEYPVPDIAILQIALDGPQLAFSAGQYAELSFDGCPARNYSMANHPHDSLLEFHVRHVPGGRTSSHVLEKMVPGDRVQLQGPLGTAHLRVRRTGPILAVVGGTGLAPILSILKAAAALKLTQPVRLYRFARDASGFYGGAELDTLVSALPDFACRQIFSRRDERLAEFAASLPDLTGATAYAAGSPALVDATSAILTEHGLPPERIFADAFFTTADQQGCLVSP